MIYNLEGWVLLIGGNVLFWVGVTLGFFASKAEAKRILAQEHEKEIWMYNVDSLIARGLYEADEEEDHGFKQSVEGVEEGKDAR